MVKRLDVANKNSLKNYASFDKKLGTLKSLLQKYALLEQLPILNITAIPKHTATTIPAKEASADTAQTDSQENTNPEDNADASATTDTATDTGSESSSDISLNNTNTNTIPASANAVDMALEGNAIPTTTASNDNTEKNTAVKAAGILPEAKTETNAIPATSVGSKNNSETTVKPPAAQKIPPNTPVSEMEAFYNSI